MFEVLIKASNGCSRMLWVTGENMTDECASVDSLRCRDDGGTTYGPRQADMQTAAEEVILTRCCSLLLVAAFAAVSDRGRAAHFAQVPPEGLRLAAIWE